MAIAFDAGSEKSSVFSGSSPVTLAHTCAGANRILLVWIATNKDFATITGVTYNGVAMAEITGSPTPASGSQQLLGFYLVAPATGANNIAVAFTGFEDFAIVGVSLVGVDQAVPLGTWAEASGLTATPATATVDVSSASGEVVVGAAFGRHTGNGSPATLDAYGAGQTAVNDIANSEARLAVSYEDGAATTTHSVDFSAGFSNVGWAIGAVPLKPASSAQTLSMSTISSGAVVRAPTVAYRVQPPTIASAVVVRAPSITVGTVALQPPTIASAAVVRAPSVAYRVAPPTIASTAVVRAPSVSPGAVSLSPPTIASTLVVRAPAVGTLIVLPTIAAGAVVRAPVVSPGAVGLILPTIASGAVVRAPTVGQRVHLPTIAITAALNTPVVTTSGQTLVLPTIASGVVVRTPTVSRGAIALALATIASGGIVRAPSVAQRVQLPAIASTAVVRAPAVAAVLRPPTIASALIVRAPAVAYRLSLPSLASGVQLYVPTLFDGTIDYPDAVELANILTAVPTVSGVVWVTPSVAALIDRVGTASNITVRLASGQAEGVIP